jgi:hypothetical protein
MTHPPHPPSQDDPRYQPDPRFAPPQSPPGRRPADPQAPQHQAGPWGTSAEPGYPRQAPRGYSQDQPYPPHAEPYWPPMMRPGGPIPPGEGLQSGLPTSPPPRRRHRGWLIALATFTTLLVIGTIANAFSKPQPPTNSSAASSSASPSPPSCSQQAAAWKHSQGWADLRKVKSDAPALTSLTRSRLASAAKFGGTLMAADARRALAHPIPSCADPHGYYTTAMTTFSQSANAAEAARYTLALIRERQAWRLLVKDGLAKPVKQPSRPRPKPKPTPVTSAPAVIAPSPTAPSPQGCYPLSNEGTCYEPGEYCRSSDQGTTGIAGDGEKIICEDNDGLRWEPVG